MNLCKHWKEGRYSSIYLYLSSSIQGSVCWGTIKNNTPWVAHFLDKEVGQFKELDQAKEAVEKEARKQANTVLFRLNEKL